MFRMDVALVLIQIILSGFLVSVSLWIPQTKKYIIEGRSLSIGIRNELHEYVKDQMVGLGPYLGVTLIHRSLLQRTGNAADSFTSMLL